MKRTFVKSTSIRAVLASAATVVTGLVACAPAAAAVPTAPGYQTSVFATGGSLKGPDDIAYMRGVIYVVYQNATGKDGSTDAAGLTSTVVGYRPDGTETGSWNVVGHADGLAADGSRLIVTVNEDANSSLYTIKPNAPADRAVRHYNYAPGQVTHGGGTDAVSVMEGRILISASNPSGNTGPATYIARIPEHGSFVSLKPAFYDDSQAANANNNNQPTTLNLSDPDSNGVVPRTSPLYGGDFVLDSQGDSQLIFARHPGRPNQSLTLLNLSSSSGGQAPQVDDVTWTTRPNGTLYAVDAGTSTVYAITGPFAPGTALTSIPAGSPPSNLDGDLGTINLSNGVVSPFMTGFASPKGLLYVPAHGSGGGDQGHHRSGQSERRGQNEGNQNAQGGHQHHGG